MSTKNRIKISDEAKSAMVYVFSSVLAKGLAILTVPIFTRIMPSSQVGEVSVFISWYAILSGIVSLGLTSGGLMMCLNQFRDEKDGYLSSILTLSSLSAIIIGALYIYFSNVYKNILNLPDSLIILMLVCFLFSPAYDFWLAKQRYDYKYKLSGTIMVASSVLASVAAVISVLVLPKAGIASYAEARVFGTYVITLSIAAVIWIVIFIKGKTLINLKYWKYSLVLSLPLIGQMLAAQVLGVSDRIMIERYCGDSEVGIYSTIYTIGTLTTMLWTAINGTFTPYMYKNIESHGAVVKKNSLLIITSFSFISILVVLFAPEITTIVGPKEYSEGIYIIPPVAAGVYLIAIGDLYSNLLIYAQKTQYIMIGTAVGALLNIFLNAMFIPIYGYIAAAYTTLFSYVVMVFLLIVFAKLIYKENVINIGDVLAQRKIYVLSITTILIDLICMATYTDAIIRYLVVTLVCIIAVFFIKRTNVLFSIKS